MSQEQSHIVLGGRGVGRRHNDGNAEKGIVCQLFESVPGTFCMYCSSCVFDRKILTI